MLNFVTSKRSVTYAKIVLVMKIAVNILARMPQKSVTANPLIGPVPNWKSTRAAIMVVTFASIIVVNALE